MQILTLVALGGALGAVARYGVGGWIHVWSGAGLPWGTFGVNVLGSLLLGFSVRFLEGIASTPELRVGVTVGFLGAFTTFSTFSYETLVLLQEREWGRAALYGGGSVVLGLAGVLLGLYLGSVVLERG